MQRAHLDGSPRDAEREASLHWAIRGPPSVLSPMDPRQSGYCGGILLAAATCGATGAVKHLAAADGAEVNQANEVRWAGGRELSGTTPPEVGRWRQAETGARMVSASPHSLHILFSDYVFFSPHELQRQLQRESEMMESCAVMVLSTC